MSLSKTFYPQLSTGSIQEGRKSSQHVDKAKKHYHKHNRFRRTGLFTHLNVMSSMNCDTTSKRVMDRVIPNIWFTVTSIETHVEMDWVAPCNMNRFS